MKTVSTKLENVDFNRLMDMCNDDGQCISESLREMIKQHLDCHEEWKENEKSEDDESIKTEPKPPKITILRTFTCSNGNLYEDGDLVGPCSDFDMSEGNVWKDGEQI